MASYAQQPLKNGGAAERPPKFMMALIAGSGLVLKALIGTIATFMANMPFWSWTGVPDMGAAFYIMAHQVGAKTGDADAGSGLSDVCGGPIFAILFQCVLPVAIGGMVAANAFLQSPSMGCTAKTIAVVLIVTMTLSWMLLICCASALGGATEKLPAAALGELGAMIPSRAGLVVNYVIELTLLILATIASTGVVPEKKDTVVVVAPSYGAAV